MGLWDIAINNLKRRRVKMLLIIIGIAIGIATVVTLFSLTTAMHNKITNDLEKMGTKLLLTPQSEKISFTYGGIIVAQDVAFDIKTISKNVLSLLEAKAEELNIKYIVPKNVQTVELEGKPNLLVGMDINIEFMAKPWLKVKGDLPGQEKQILLGNNLAGQMAKDPGDTVLINNQELIVSGVLNETGQQEDNIILAPLALAEELSGNSTLSLVEITLDTNPNTNADINNLKAIIPGVKVTTVQDVMESRKEVIKRYEKFAFIVSIIVLVILVLIVLTTMLGAVNERIREIAIFRAIGFSKKDILHILFFEATLVCILGGLIGYILGVITAKGAAPKVETDLLINWNPLLAAIMLAVTIIVGLLAGWLPAVKAIRLDPHEVLRNL